MKTARYHPFLLLVLVFLLFFATAALPPHVFAQDNACLTGLSNEDCALLAAMEPNMGFPQTFNLNYDISLKASGYPRIGNIDATIKGVGIASTANISQLTVPAFVQNFQFATSAQVTISGTPTLNYSGQIDLRLVNGVLYIQGEKINKNDGWLKVMLTNLTGNSAQGTDLSPLMNYFTPSNIRAICQCTTVDVSHGKSEVAPKIDGKAVKKISAVFDFGTAYDQLRTSAEKQQFLSQLMAEFVGSAGSVNLQDPLQLAAAEKSMRGTTLEYSWFITPDDHMYHGFAVKISVYIDPLLKSLAGSSSTQAPGMLNGQATLILSKIGRKIDIPPP